MPGRLSHSIAAAGALAAALAALAAVATAPARAQPRPAPAHAAPFDRVEAWGPLRWNMDPAAALAALRRVGIPGREEEGPQGIFPTAPTAPGRPDAPLATACVWFRSVHFRSEGREATAEFANGALREVRVLGAPLPRAAALARLAALRGAYGPPIREETVAGGFRLYHWESATTRLVLSVGEVAPGRWRAAESYQPREGARLI